jgi:hypothetical protein
MYLVYKYRLRSKHLLQSSTFEVVVVIEINILEQAIYVGHFG